MNPDYETILKGLRERAERGPDRIRSPYLYLDPGLTAYVFHELTGLEKPPGFALSVSEEKLDLSPDAGLPDHILMDAMWPVLEKKVPKLASDADVPSLVHEFALVDGRLEATHFPDGNLNLEIKLGSLRGLLFYTDKFFSSLVGPIIGQDNFFDPEWDVKALVWLAGGLESMIYYHQTYGDNQEYEWLPLTPAAIRLTGRAAE